jgi:hypothetical protein
MLILSARLIASSALVCRNLRSFPQLSQEKPHRRYQMLQFNRPHACFRSINGMKSQRYPHNAARESGTVSRKGVATRSGEHCGLVPYSTIWQAQLPPDRLYGEGRRWWRPLSEHRETVEEFKRPVGTDRRSNNSSNYETGAPYPGSAMVFQVTRHGAVVCEHWQVGKKPIRNRAPSLSFRRGGKRPIDEE